MKMADTCLGEDFQGEIGGEDMLETTTINFRK
jgi:hypothetical protein